MPALQSRQITLAARPRGLPVDSDWRLEARAVAEPQDGEVLVRTTWLTLEPAMRGWMDDRPSYMPPVQVGEAMRATGVAEVVRSAAPGLAPGDHVIGLTGVREYATLKAETLRKIDVALAPADVHAGLLATSGFTAYFGLFDIGRPEPGQTVVVSGAAGAVGSIAGQIARLHGCRVVGLAGGAHKRDWLLDELGFDAAVDYRNDDLLPSLAAACPEGVDVYFDNVGNPVLDAVLKLINLKARIVLCGAVSQYNATGRVDGPSNYIALIVKRARMEGLIVTDYRERYPEAAEKLASWWRQGRLRYRTDVSSGIESFPAQLRRMFRGENLGKCLLRMNDG